MWSGPLDSLVLTLHEYINHFAEPYSARVDNINILVCIIFILQGEHGGVGDIGTSGTSGPRVSYFLFLSKDMMEYVILT